MNPVNKTLYIPLYGKAYVSQKGLFLEDEKAVEIWEKEGFSLRGKAKSKWLAYYMGIRSAVFDKWLTDVSNKMENTVVIHLGCGMDARACRVEYGDKKWYDVDFPQVIEERKRYYKESGNYRMISADVRESNWLENIPERESAVVVMEGISMYMSAVEVKALFKMLKEHFEKIVILMDCYSIFAAKMSKYKNPVNSVGVTEVYGIDHPKDLEVEGIAFEKEHDMTPPQFTDQLSGFEKKVFKKLYAGKTSRKLYKLFEYKSV